MKMFPGEQYSNYILWLKEKLPSDGYIGYDPLLLPASNDYIKELDELDRLDKELKGRMREIEENLVDKLWEGKPGLSKDAVFVHDVEYTGESAEDRLKKMVNLLAKSECTSGIITGLGNIAWGLNLRGSDIECNPYFTSYLIINLKGTKPEFNLYADQDKFKDKKVQEHLEKTGIKLSPYEKAVDDIKTLEKQKIGIELNSTNAKIITLIRSKDNIIIDTSDTMVLLRKRNNSIQLEGFRQCHIRDGLALVKFIAWLENEIAKVEVNEYQAEEKMLEFRKAQPKFVGLALYSTSASGVNSGTGHYIASKETAAKITNKEIYLHQSAAHYL